MVKFDNFETTLAYKWFINLIDEVLMENKGKDMNDLISLLSVEIEEKIKEELSECNEGYVSDLIGNSFDNIDYHAMVLHYIKYNG